MKVCIVFNLKYFMPEASVSQIMGRDAKQKQAARRLLVEQLRGQKGLQPPS